MRAVDLARRTEYPWATDAHWLKIVSEDVEQRSLCAAVELLAACGTSASALGEVADAVLSSYRDRVGPRPRSGLSDALVRALIRGVQVAALSGTGFVESHHLLTALAWDGGNRILHSLGIELDDLLEHGHRFNGIENEPSLPFEQPASFSDVAVFVHHDAMLLARRSDQSPYVTSAHILLALIDSPSIAREALRRLGIGHAEIVEAIGDIDRISDLEAVGSSDLAVRQVGDPVRDLTGAARPPPLVAPDAHR